MSVVAQLPTVYEYYTSGGVTAGLSANQPYFTLNNRNITLFSGAMHYFRVPKEYWRNRLRKMRAAGLNAVETYVPWNLHEPQVNYFDFGNNGSDMESFLDIAKFLKTAQEEDLLAIVRPGPFICSEWEFGGLPSWLLRDKGIKIRTSEPTFMKHVTRYFNVLLPILAALQFTKGGPIIAMQIENEYGSTEQKGKFIPDKRYLEELRQMHLRNGIVELLFTSDSPTAHGSVGTLPGVLLQTANFAVNPEIEFNRLKELQLNKPAMAMEFWTGWFDHWSEQHHLRNNAQFENVLERILKYPASVNMYMFHGGTNWGFLNGANMMGDKSDNRGFQPDTTSYDYDAPLNEAGDYTEKYVIVRRLLEKYSAHIRIPHIPSVTERQAYPKINIHSQLNLAEIIDLAPVILNSSKPIAMELIPVINNGSGQSYGYIIYKKEHLNIPKNAILKLAGHISDTVSVMINGVLISKPLKSKADLDGFGFWRINSGTLNLGPEAVSNATLELVMENWGRVNFGNLNQFLQYKGIHQAGVYLNNQELLGWKIVPLDFKKKWTNSLVGWHDPIDVWLPGPSLFKANLVLDQPRDTYIDMREWGKGIVIVNGFVLGRYASMLGPQQTLYLPAPLLKNGTNDVVIFEQYYSGKVIKFVANPIFFTPPSA